MDDLVHDSLNFQADAIMQGELWRMVTGHFLHTNLNHMLLNYGGLFLLWGLHGEHYLTKQTMLLGVCCSFIASAGLLFFTDIQFYVGLSSIVHAIFAWGAVQDLKMGMKSAWILLGGLTFKISWEQYHGNLDNISDMIGAAVAIDSHLWGAISGFVMALFIKSHYAKQKQADSDTA